MEYSLDPNRGGLEYSMGINRGGWTYSLDPQGWYGIFFGSKQGWSRIFYEYKQGGRVPQEAMDHPQPVLLPGANQRTSYSLQLSSLFMIMIVIVQCACS